MKLHIATLGLYANERIDHVLMKRGADRVVLIYTERNEEEVREIRTRYKSKGIPVESELVDPWRYEEILAKIIEVIIRHPNHEIEFNISCGSRVMAAASHMAAVLTESTVYFVTEREETRIGDLVTVQPLSLNMLTEPKRRILENLQVNGGAVGSQAELGSRAELHAASISRHLKELEQVGYIEREKHGHKKSISITTLGRAILALKNLRRQRKWGDGDNA